MRALVALGILLAPGLAQAQRPALVDAETRLGPMGEARVHFTRTGVDAVAPLDADMDGTPDFVAEVAAVAEEVLADVVLRGFRPPVSDGAGGGDGAFDAYLKAFGAGADGHYQIELCGASPFTCSGYFEMDSDLVGFGYPSVSVGIRVLVSHELFHAVQAAYDADQPINWSEGTAVWYEEQIFPDQDDFEAFVPYFLAKPSRPFDRPGSGFGDLYPYGAALWPAYLEERFGEGTVAAIWEACVEAGGDDPDFLDAAEVVLVRDHGVSLADAWIEFTRWNLFTGARADATRGWPSAGAAAWGEAPVELTVNTLPSSQETSLEGFSARYARLELASSVGMPRRVVVSTTDRVAAMFFPDGGGPGEAFGPGNLEMGGIQLNVAEDDARSGYVVLSSVRRGSIAFVFDVRLEIDDSPPMIDDGTGNAGCGCRAAGRSDPPGRGGAIVTIVTILAFLAAVVLRRPGASASHRHRR